MDECRASQCSYVFFTAARDARCLADQVGHPARVAGQERALQIDQISQNIAAVLEFYTREEQKISRSQRILERISRFIVSARV
jgi:hypothetical protein